MTTRTSPTSTTSVPAPPRARPGWAAPRATSAAASLRAIGGRAGPRAADRPRRPRPSRRAAAPRFAAASFARRSSKKTRAPDRPSPGALALGSGGPAPAGQVDARGLLGDVGPGQNAGTPRGFGRYQDAAVGARSGGIEALETVERGEPLLRIVEGKELPRDARSILPSQPHAPQPPLLGGVPCGIGGPGRPYVLPRDPPGRGAQRPGAT